MTSTSVLTKLKSGITKLIGIHSTKKEWPFQDEKVSYLVDESALQRLCTAVIDVSAKEVPELIAMNYTPGDSSQGFQSMVYRNRVEQMYERIRKSRRKTFTLNEAQALSGLSTDIRSSVAHLIDKGFVVKTNNKRRSKIYAGLPGRYDVSDRFHSEYKLVKTCRYVGQRTGYGSAAVWG
jgi:hypothetical protein